MEFFHSIAECLTRPVIRIHPTAIATTPRPSHLPPKILFVLNILYVCKKMFSTNRYGASSCTSLVHQFDLSSFILHRTFEISFHLVAAVHRTKEIKPTKRNFNLNFCMFNLSSLAVTDPIRFGKLGRLFQFGVALKKKIRVKKHLFIHHWTMNSSIACPLTILLLTGPPNRCFRDRVQTPTSGEGLGIRRNGGSFCRRRRRESASMMSAS